MPFVLSDLILQRGTLSADEAARIARATAVALADAHAHGRVHGRLTTDDISVSGDLHPVVTLTPPRPDVVAELLPPEVRSGMPAVFSADLWSLGKAIQAMLGPTDTRGPLAALTLRLVSENPWDRPVAASEVVALLDDVLEPEPLVEAMPQDGRPEPLPLATHPEPRADAEPEPAPAVETISRQPPAPEPTTADVPDEPKRKTRVLVGAAVVVGALIAGGVGVATNGREARRETLASATSLSLSFDPEQYPTGLVSSTRWTLSGSSGDTLTANVLLTNTNATALSTTYDVVVPKSIASSAKDLEFQPTPDKVIKDDPVVRFNVKLASGATMSVGYRSVVPGVGLTQQRLTEWSSDLASAESAERTIKPVVIALASIAIAPSSLSLVAGDTQQLGVTGTTTSGHPAAGAFLAGTAWTSSNPGVATVDQAGIVSGTGAGTSQISAQVGKVKSTIPVSVTAAPAGFTPRPATGQEPPPIVAPPVATHPATRPGSLPPRPVVTSNPGPKPTTSTVGAGQSTPSPTPSPTPTGQPPSVGQVEAHLTGDRVVSVHWPTNDNGGGSSSCQVLFNGQPRWNGPCAVGANQGVNVSGLAYSTSYQVVVGASNSRGSSSSPPSNVQTNAAPSGSLRLSKGARYQGGGCTSPSCAYFFVDASGFTPNTSYSISCVDAQSGPFYSYTATTNASGALSSTGRCWYGYQGKQVFVTMGGVESNRLTWS